MKKGFSLIELIVVIMISSIIGVALFQVYNQAVKILKRVDSIVSSDMKIVTFYDRFEKDVSGAFIPVIGDLELAKRVLEKHEGEVRAQQLQTQDQVKGGEKGVQKDQAKAVKPITLGDIQVKKSFFYSQTSDNLGEFSFITSNPLEVYQQVKPRIARVTYSLAPQEDNKDLFRLIRRESKKLPLNAVKSERGFTLLNNIKKLRLELLATEPEKEEPEEEKEQPAVSQDKKKSAGDKKVSENKKEKKEEEEKPKPLQSYTNWPPDGEKETGGKKSPPRNLPEFVKVFVTYADQIEMIDKVYEFTIPIFSFHAPSKELLSAQLIVQERVKKDEEAAGSSNIQKNEKKASPQETKT